jgi:cytoskeleton protein RodZ
VNSDENKPMSTPEDTADADKGELPRGMRGIDDAGEEPGGQMMLPLPRGIRTMRAEEASQLNHPATIVDGDPSMDLRERVDAALGHHLVAARELRGWTRAEVATRLKLPVRLVERLECDDYAGISDGVFLRGYLASYARLVGVPVEQATRVAQTHARTVPLVATGTISRTRYLFERYSVSATYLVLTAIIVVPAVWLATHGGLEQNLVRTTPLDPPAHVASSPTTTSIALPEQHMAEDHAGDVPVESAPSLSLPEQTPVVASMAPFSAAPASAPEPTSAASARAGEGGHLVRLTLAQQSWVEIVATDGRKLEYSMLAAGEHTYRNDSAATVRIGNVQGAELDIDGAAFDLAPYQRGNVAHFKLLADGSIARPSRVEQ